MLLDAVKGEKPVSLREFGFKWIGFLGTMLLPLVLIFRGRSCRVAGGEAMKKTDLHPLP